MPHGRLPESCKSHGAGLEEILCRAFRQLKKESLSIAGLRPLRGLALGFYEKVAFPALRILGAATTILVFRV